MDDEIKLCNICHKNAADEGFKTCLACRKERKEQRAQKYAYRREHGLCRYCGMPLDNLDYSSCSFCRKRRSIWQKERYAENPQHYKDKVMARRNSFAEKGLCRICGGIIDNDKYYTCTKCRDNHKGYRKKWRAKSLLKILEAYKGKEQ